MTLTLDLDPHLEKQLRQEAARLGVGPDDLVRQTISERLRQSRPMPPHLSRQESNLLEKINRGLPPETWRRFDELVARRDAKGLTGPEQRELLELSDEVETDHVARLQLVAELARLRNVPLLELMKQLGIGPRMPGGADA